MEEITLFTLFVHCFMVKKLVFFSLPLSFGFEYIRILSNLLRQIGRSQYALDALPILSVASCLFLS